MPSRSRPINGHLRYLRRLSCCAVLLLLWSGIPLQAQGGPPLRTDDPGTPGNGNWEINVGLTTDRRASEREFEAPIVDINYGLGNRIQLKFEIPWIIKGTDVSSTRSGVGNSLLGVKWRFYENKKLDLAFSTYPQFSFNNPADSVHRGLVTRGKRLLLPLEVTKRIGPLDVDAEVGRWLSEFGPDQWITGLAAGKQVLPRLEMLGELYRVRDVGTSDRETTFGFGGRLRLADPLLLMFMAGRSFSDPNSGQPQLIGYLGLQIQLQRHRGSSASLSRGFPAVAH